MSYISKKLYSSFLPIVLSLAVLLTGCVHYEVGINIEDQHHGSIVQYIKLGQQLTTLSQAETQEWLSSIEHRATQLKGKAERVSPQEIAVTIPFSNGQELTNKFNQFFNPNPPPKNTAKKTDSLDLVQLKSHMTIHQNNLIFLERNHLNLEVDLRALGVLSNQGNIIVSPGSLIDLEFALNAPWGAKSLDQDGILQPLPQPENQSLLWQLQPGQINKIEVVFWTPSFLGLGTLAIFVIIIIGFYLKYKRLPLMVSQS